MKTCEKLEEAGLYIEGMDYVVAMKVPHFMRKAGLQDVDTRMNDRVTYLEPGQSDYAVTLADIRKAEHWSEEKNTHEKAKQGKQTIQERAFPAFILWILLCGKLRKNVIQYFQLIY